MTLMATRLFNGGSCSASYTSPKAPEPIHLVTRQSPSSAPCSKYLQKGQATCPSTATGLLPMEAPGEATLRLPADELSVPLFSFRLLLGRHNARWLAMKWLFSFTSQTGGQSKARPGFALPS